MQRLTKVQRKLKGPISQSDNLTGYGAYQSLISGSRCIIAEDLCCLKGEVCGCPTFKHAALHLNVGHDKISLAFHKLYALYLQYPTM